MNDVHQTQKLLEVARRWLNTEDVVLAASADLAEGIYQSVLTQRGKSFARLFASGQY